MAKKRTYSDHDNNQIDDNDDNDETNLSEQQQIEKLENDLNFYKEKLIILARAHATLLTLVGAKPGESFHASSARKEEEDDAKNKKEGERKQGRGDGERQEEEEEDEEGEKMLISNSQLSTLSDEEEEDMEEEEDTASGGGVGESQETHMTISTLGSATVLLDGEDAQAAQAVELSQTSQTTKTITFEDDQNRRNNNSKQQQQQQNNNNLLPPLSPLLPFDRWNSIASQRSAFSDFIIESGDVLGSLPEMEEWLDLTGNSGGGEGGSSSSSAAVVVNANSTVGQNQNNCNDAFVNREEAERQRTGLLPKSFVEREETTAATTATVASVKENFTNNENGNKRDNSSSKVTTVPTPTTSALKRPVHVRVGVGVLVKDPLYPHKVFAGIRKGSHGSNTLALPGGHLELQESWSQCATREVLEETGLHISNVVFGHVTNDMMPSENKHYVTIFMMGTCVEQNVRPQNLEPHKCEGWSSYGWDELRDMIQADQENEMGGQVRQKRRRKGLATLPKLFGPLRHLVEEEPSTVLDFLKS